MTLFRMPLQFNAEGVVPLIAQGWRQPTLGYACSEEVNAVGVVRFMRGMPWCNHAISHAMQFTFTPILPLSIKRKNIVCRAM